MRAIVIGVGGAGSILAPILVKLIGARHVLLVDGDTLEPKNLDRQMFSESDLGRNKAEAMATRIGCGFMDRFYDVALMEHNRMDWLLVCVDNHPARMEALKACDRSKCSAILCANETLSSEAYLYRPRWLGTPMDPRVMYPEILTDRSGDPRGREIGCTGEAQAQNPQLVTANMMAASLALHLFVVWAMESRKLDEQTLDYLPHKLVCNMTRMVTHIVNQNQKDTHE